MNLTVDYQLIEEKYVGYTGYGNVYLRIYAKYNKPQNIVENETPVSVKLVHYLSNGTITYFSSSGNITGNVTASYSGETNKKFNAGETILVEKTVNIKHEINGTKKINIGGNFTNSFFDNTVTIEQKECLLPTIPRASTITATTAEIEFATTIVINRASSNFRNTLKYEFGILKETIIEKTDKEIYGWIIPNYFYGQISDSDYGICKLICETYDGNDLIGESTTQFIVKVNHDLNKPIIEVTSITENNIDLIGGAYGIIKGESILRVEYNITAKNGTTIKSKTVDGKQIPDDIFYIVRIEEPIKKIIAIDNRGIPAEYVIDLTNKFIDYIPISLDVEVKRKGATTGEAEMIFSGNFFNGDLNFTSEVSSKKNGIIPLAVPPVNNPNYLRLYWGYMLKSGDDFIPVGYLTEGEDYTISGNKFYSGTGMDASPISLGNMFDYKEKYDIFVYYWDNLAGHVIPPTIPYYLCQIKPLLSGESIFWWNKTKFTVNKKLTCAGDGIFKKNLITGADSVLTKQNYTAISNYFGFDCSELLIGNVYKFTSNIPIYWFKISDIKDGNGSVEFYNPNGFEELIFTMNKHPNITGKQYIFIGINPGYVLPSSISSYDNYTFSIKNDLNEIISYIYKKSNSIVQQNKGTDYYKGNIYDNLVSGKLALVVQNLDIGGVYFIAVNFNGNTNGSEYYRLNFTAILSIPVGYNGSYVSVQPQINVLSDYGMTNYNGTFASNAVSFILEGGGQVKNVNTWLGEKLIYLTFNKPSSDIGDYSITINRLA